MKKEQMNHMPLALSHPLYDAISNISHFTKENNFPIHDILAFLYNTRERRKEWTVAWVSPQYITSCIVVCTLAYIPQNERRNLDTFSCLLCLLQEAQKGWRLCDDVCQKTTVSRMSTYVFVFKMGRDSGDWYWYIRRKRNRLLRSRRAIALLLTARGHRMLLISSILQTSKPPLLSWSLMWKLGKDNVMYCLLKLLSLERVSCFIAQDYRLVGYTPDEHSKAPLVGKQHCKVSKKHGT